MVFHLEEDMTLEKSDCNLTSTVKNLPEQSTPVSCPWLMV